MMIKNGIGKALDDDDGDMLMFISSLDSRYIAKKVKLRLRRNLWSEGMTQGHSRLCVSTKVFDSGSNFESGKGRFNLVSELRSKRRRKALDNDDGDMFMFISSLDSRLRRNLWSEAFGKLLEEVHVTWTQFRKKRDKIAALHKVTFKECVQCLETATGFVATPFDITSDGVKTFVTASKRNRLNETLEDLAKRRPCVFWARDMIISAFLGHPNLDNDAPCEHPTHDNDDPCEHSILDNDAPCEHPIHDNNASCEHHIHDNVASYEHPIHDNDAPCEHPKHDNDAPCEHPKLDLFLAKSEL
ncbi:hypothetical protein Tco_1517884 [Tanacetum coccineum]